MSKFRETLWFKKGLSAPEADLPDTKELAEDPADADLPDPDLPSTDLPGAPAADSLRPLEDRYADDGSLTAADIEELSLNTPAIGPSPPKTLR